MFNSFDNWRRLHKPVTLFGNSFQSTLEGARWLELKQWEEEGIIFDLQRQVRLRIEQDGKHVCDYIADFVYKDVNGVATYEDVKGAELSSEFKQKQALLKSIYGIDVQVIRACRIASWAKKQATEIREGTWKGAA